jgi:Golgi SNAP receptor complex protein 1
VKQSTLTRHKEILHDHRRELQRLKSAIADARKKASLLSNVQSDISSYRALNPNQGEADYMLDERRHIDSSHNMIDGILSRAYSVNETMGFQRENLAIINRKIVGAASQVPGLNTLIARIGSRKRRDSIILASFIAFCFLMVLYFR